VNAGVTVPDLLDARAAVEPERVAIRTVEGSGPLTFGAWTRCANGLARRLHELGV
jgi:hypothetical protein